MVRNKKLLPLGVPAASSPRKQKGTLDEFVSSQPEPRTALAADKMTPGSLRAGSVGTSAEELNREDALTIIRQELAAISDRMLSKADTGGLIQELRAAVREELAALRADLTMVEVRVDALETEAQACQTQHRTAELATTRQDKLLLTLRRQVEDLENRSRRRNIRIRGRTPHRLQIQFGLSLYKFWTGSAP
ncbi:vomeronasal type-2 receptor 26-like [Pelobates cultripes]|uniref:Vomeronasal type-2 receptor 26-like n=1 Tax=Pelobates cultripes TaxID=61616 RepID=A0AAD1WAQ2_PELCU|nr:vomeronasal type-2 receptor 26-like [Pelobates cultripes]